MPESSSPRPSRLRRLSLVALAGLIPLVPILIGAVLLSSTTSHAAPGSVMRALAAPPGAPNNPSHKPAGAPKPHGTTAEVAILRQATELYASPGGAVIAAQPLSTQFGSPVVYLVRRSVPGWLGVVSPLAGNGRIGWIPSSSAKLGSVDWRLTVSLSRRELTVVDNGTVVQRYKVAVGRPSAPTPTGTFAVTDRLQTGDPSGPYGCCILALSALAPHAIQDWGGGNRIAIHSTPETSSIGLPVSHGCLRLTLAEGRWLLGHVPLGTPTLISS